MKSPLAVFSGISFVTLLVLRNYLFEHINLPSNFPSWNLTDNLQTKRVTLFPNGESQGGVEVVLVESDFINSTYFAQYVSTLVPVPVYQMNESVVADRVYNGNGKLIEFYDDIQTGDNLYAIAPGLHFVWPFVKLGHKVYLHGDDYPNGKPIIIESFSDNPRIFHIHNFFTDEDADQLIDHVSSITDELNKLQQSSVGHLAHKKVKSSVRTSYNAFDQVSPTAMKLKMRSFSLLSLPTFDDAMADGLQILRYNQKQAYIPHEDYFAEDTDPSFNWSPYKGGSNRFATVFLYLSDVALGGQTVFPESTMPPDAPMEYQHPVNNSMKELPPLFENGTWEYDMVEKCQTQLAAYPKKRHAILFYSQKADGSLNPMSIHGGCPVIEGTKWAANLWVWNKAMFGRHKKSNEKLDIMFKNPSDVTLQLYWDSTFMTDMPPNSEKTYHTYDGHSWSIRDGDITILKYTAEAESGLKHTVVVPTNWEDSQDEPLLPMEEQFLQEQQFLLEQHLMEDQQLMEEQQLMEDQQTTSNKDEL